MEARPSCETCKCITHAMGRTLFLCFSTFQPDNNLSEESRVGPSYWCHPRPFLADTALVYNAPSPINRQPSVPASAGLSLNTTSQQHSTPSSQAVKVDGLQNLGKSLQQRNISEKAATIILQSWSDGTQRQYKLYIKQWIDFCCERQADPYNPPLTTVLDFLVNLHEKGLSYTAITTARSAISAITLSEDKNTIGYHPHVSRFMKGIYKGSPPTPRYQSTWDFQPVLTYLAATNPVDKLDLNMLTLKLVMLIALVSAQRGQSLHILDIGPGCMKEVPDGYEFLLTAHIKQRRPGYKAPTVVFRAHPANPSHCVCTCLKEYLKRTKPLRGTETKLFVSFTKPHKWVSRETLSRWIRTVMTSAGVDTTIFKPHSTRAVATSKANTASVPIQEILKTAGWSSSRCFDKFYDKPVESSTFASAILKTV